MLCTSRYGAQGTHIWAATTTEFQATPWCRASRHGRFTLWEWKQQQHTTHSDHACNMLHAANARRRGIAGARSADLHQAAHDAQRVVQAARRLIQGQFVGAAQQHLRWYSAHGHVWCCAAQGVACSGEWQQRQQQ